MSEKTNLSPEGITEEFGSLINMYETILQKMVAVAYINDVVNDRLLWANDQYFDILGYSRGELIEMKKLSPLLQKIMHLDDVPIYQASIKEYMESGNDYWGGFQRGIHKNGKHVWLYGFCRVLKYQDDGKTPAIGISVFIDYSNQIATTNQLEELVKENNRLKNQILISVLTRKEKEILRHVAHGNSDKGIAKKLFISAQTVHTHRKNILRKLKINNTASLVKLAVDCGLA